MIVISTGVPKSATTLVLEYQKDLFEAVSDTQGIKEFLRRNNGWLWVKHFEDEKTEVMLEIAREFGSLLVKTHSPPTKNALNLVREFDAKVTCCYRDPRDNVLSALDHGRRTRQAGDLNGSFARFFTVEDAAWAIKGDFEIYQGWKASGSAFMIKYEDLLGDKFGTVSRMCQFLGLDIEEWVLRRIVDKHERIKESAENYNTGASYRWQREMTIEQLKICDDILGDEIEAMGYESIRDI